MHSSLKKYKQAIDSITSPADIDDWITYGDWMLLTTVRIVLEEAIQHESLGSEDREMVVQLDARLGNIMTEAQLKELGQMEPDMPLKKWWGQG